MSNVLDNLGKPQQGTSHDGAFFLVADLGTSAPATVAAGYRGFGKGAIAVNTSTGSLDSNKRILINTGTAEDPVWQPLVTAA